MPVHAIPALADPPFVAALLLQAAGLGVRLTALLRLPASGSTRGERGVVAVALGLGILSFVPFVLGVAHALRPATVAALTGALWLACVPDQGRVLRAAWRWAAARRGVRPGVWPLVWGACALPVLAVALVGALTPPTDPDGLYYQLTAPRRWLESGSLAYLPTLPQTNLPAGMNMLFALAMALWSDTAAKLVHTLAGLLTLSAIFLIGRRMQGARTGLLAALFWLLGTASVFSLRVPNLLACAYSDLGVAFQSCAAVLSWLLWRRSGHRGWLVCAALCAGFASTFKFTAVLIGGAMALLVAGERRAGGARWGEALGAGTGTLGIALLPLLPWLARTAIATGNPFYLILADLFPTRDWSAEAARIFNDYFKYYVWGAGYAIDLSLAQRKAIRLGAILLAAGVAAVALRGSRDRETRGLVAIAAILVLSCLWSTGLYLRYVLFALPFVYVLALRRADRMLERSSAARVGVALFLAANALLALRPSLRTLSLDLRAATGVLSRDDYLARRFAVKPLWDYANAHVPADQPILLAAGRPGYYLHSPCFVTEAYYQFAVRMDSWEHFAADLRRNGIGYAIASSRPSGYVPLGPAWPHARNEGAFIHRLVSEYGEPLHCVGDECLYRLRPIAPALTASGGVR